LLISDQKDKHIYMYADTNLFRKKATNIYE